ncbi:MAG: hypothetical protein ACI89E_001913 [Planctomycetota bacterium]|jgi:hypothetical protein
MSFSIRRVAGVLALAAFAQLSGCSSHLLGSAGSGTTVLAQVQEAPSVTAHRGVRIFESFYNLSGKDENLSYREQIVTDGQGNFTTRPLEVFSGATLPDQEFLFLLKSREGFNWRYRDFLIRDLGAFLKNYKLTSFGKIVTVAGRECLELDIVRKDGSARWIVSMDTFTGLVLKYEEYDAAGRLFSRMKYESANFAPDLSGTVFHTLSNKELDLTGSPDPVALLGFDPLVPKLLPGSGLQFVAAYRVTDANGINYAKYEYTDGVQTVLFLDSGDQGGVKKSAPSGSSNPGGSNSYPPEKLGMFNDGPFTIMTGRALGREVIAVGKVPQRDLQFLLESALP